MVALLRLFLFVGLIVAITAKLRRVRREESFETDENNEEKRNFPAVADADVVKQSSNAAAGALVKQLHHAGNLSHITPLLISKLNDINEKVVAYEIKKKAGNQTDADKKAIVEDLKTVGKLLIHQHEEIKGLTAADHSLKEHLGKLREGLGEQVVQKLVSAVVAKRGSVHTNPLPKDPFAGFKNLG